ncbi:MAG: Gx transporter family protein [Eggerthellaceae bacterium]|nr:Gx transporter family protein [Eggerthellaceae bacterium]
MPTNAQNNSTRRLVLAALIAAVGMLLGYPEPLVPLPSPGPGIKLGFANMAILFALYAIDVRMAAVVAAAKLLVTTFTFGSPFMALFSLGGTALAFVVMVLLKRTDKVGIVGVSAAAGVAHNIGHLCVATFALGTPRVWSLAPVLMVAGVATGAITGLLAIAVIKAVSGFATIQP